MNGSLVSVVETPRTYADNGCVCSACGELSNKLYVITYHSFIKRPVAQWLDKKNVKYYHEVSCCVTLCGKDCLTLWLFREGLV